MAFYLSPLVDVKEIDLSTTIPAVATSIGAIVLRNTYKGPENKQILVTDESDLVRAFGEPTDTSYEDLMSATGFLKFGNKLYCTRVLPDDARFGGIKVVDGAGVDLTVTATLDTSTNTVDTLTPVVAGTGYQVGEKFTITTDPIGSAIGKVLTVDTLGEVLTLGVEYAGDAYVTAPTAAPTVSTVVETNIRIGGSGLNLLFGDSSLDGVIDTGELTLIDGGQGYTVGDVYDVVGSTANDVTTLNGEGATITIDSVSAGVVLTYTVTTGGTDYEAGTLDIVPITKADADGATSEVDMATGTLNDLVSGDPDDFGDEYTPEGSDLIYVIASSRGNWGGEVRVAFLDQASQIAQLQGGATRSGQPSGEFALVDSQLGKPNDFLVIVQVKDQRKSTWVTKETFNVSTNVNALDDTGSTRFVENVINQRSGYIRVAINASLLGDENDTDVIANLATMSSDTWFDLNNGSDGTGQPSDAAVIEGYRLYENPEEIDVNLIIDSNKGDTVKRNIISMCEERLDCMAVLDCPKDLVLNNKGSEATELRDWKNGQGAYAGLGFASTSYASVYGNWIEVYDKFNQKYRWLPTSGFVTGIFAKTDNVRDPWWAPAGLNRAILTGVRRLAWNPKLGFRDILYSNGINPIVTFPGEGKVIWGQKTMLAKESAFNRINVRRLFLVLEKAIATSSKYFLFEPNDPATRNLLINMIVPFLRDVQSRRGIFDFKVVCDTSNNTPARVDRNELWCNIFIKPTRTAEFIVLNFVATATGASFEEAAAAV